MRRLCVPSSGGDDTLVQYAACFESSSGDKSTIRFRLLWWGWCFNSFFLAGEYFLLMSVLLGKRRLNLRILLIVWWGDDGRVFTSAATVMAWCFSFLVC